MTPATIPAMAPAASGDACKPPLPVVGDSVVDSGVDSVVGDGGCVGGMTPT